MAMGAPNYQRGNLLSPPSSCSLPTVTAYPFPSHSHTRNPSFPPPAETMIPVKNQRRLTKLHSAGPDKFKQPGKSPNRVSQLYRLFLTLKYIAAIGRYCRLERVDDAMKLFLEMKGKGIRPNAFTYSYLIPTLCLCGKWKEARAMLGEMFDGGFPLYGHGFNLCVLALTNQGMVREAEELLEIMIERGTRPDVDSCNDLMRGYCDLGRMDEAKRVFDTMVYWGVQPDSISKMILEGIAPEEQ